MEHRTYSDELKQAAVARHLAGESQAAIAESIGVPRQTVTSWAASTDGIRQSLDSAPLSLKKELADQAAGVIHKALHIIDATLEHYIAHRDIHLDYTDGRKGMEIQVDARQQSVLSGLSLEELASDRRLRQGGGGGGRPRGGPAGVFWDWWESRPDLKPIPGPSPHNDPPSLHGAPHAAQAAVRFRAELL